MSTEDIAVLNKARDLLQDYNDQKVINRHFLIQLLLIWKKLKNFECLPVPFSFEQIGDCEIAEVRGKIADILLQKAIKIAF